MPILGKVYLIGAGPGDPGLVTVRARELIELADVIVYDHLANSKILDWANQIVRESTWQSAGRHSIPQDEIEEILVGTAIKGKQVVRLKGGDPFVFGRGGEEIDELQIDKIPFEIVPRDCLPLRRLLTPASSVPQRLQLCYNLSNWPRKSGETHAQHRLSSIRQN